MFSPIKLRGLELKNRVVLPGMNTKMVKDKNDVGEDLPAYHAARAAGGCGLNIVELVSICPECHAYLYLGLYNEHHRDQLRKIRRDPRGRRQSRRADLARRLRARRVLRQDQQA